jgi:hypothetical protein
MNFLIPITQRVLKENRIGAISLISWIVNFEISKYNRNSRSVLSFNHSLCKTFLESQQFTEFFDLLPDALKHQIKEFYPKLQPVQSPEVHFYQKLEKLEELYLSFSHFPAIQVLLLIKINKINEENKDFSDSFLALWRIAALIEEVFKQKGVKLPGVPQEGMAFFKFLSIG